jgi:hypothetical protein
MVMVRGNYNVESCITAEDGNGKVIEVVLVSGFEGQARGFYGAVLEALKVERDAHKEIVRLVDELSGIEASRTSGGNFITFTFNDYKTLKIKSDGHRNLLGELVIDAIKKAKQHPKAKITKLNRWDQKEFGDVDKYGDLYKTIFERYIKSLPNIAMIKLVDGGDNIRIILKDGRTAKSNKSSKDKFNVDLGILWAYANVMNEPIEGYSPKIKKEGPTKTPETLPDIFKELDNFYEAIKPTYDQKDCDCNNSVMSFLSSLR